MLNKKSGEIDWTKTAVEIERLIRGLNPWPSAYTQWEGKTMKIWEAEVEDVVETIDTHEPGTITEVTKHGFKVQTGLPNKSNWRQKTPSVFRALWRICPIVHRTIGQTADTH